MFHALQHLEFVINHLLIALHIFLKDNLHCNLARWTVCLPNDAIRPCAKSPTEAVLRPN
jgi:hypothetical protein